VGSLDLAAFQLFLAFPLLCCDRFLGQHAAFLDDLLIQGDQVQPKGL
jgi:hypothetical protein